MAKPGIQVDGLDDLRKELRRVKDKELDAEMKAIHKQLADEVADRARPKVPVRSGALRDSLRTTGTVRDAIGRVGRTSVPYAAVIHWGSPKRGIRSRPFLTDAAAAMERDITDRYDQQVAEMLNKVVGR